MECHIKGSKEWPFFFLKKIGDLSLINWRYIEDIANLSPLLPRACTSRLKFLAINKFLTDISMINR